MQFKSEASLDSKDKNDVKNKTDLLKLKAANDLAYNMLMLAVDDPISFEAVSSACTGDLPDGDAALAWSKLESIYAKKSTTKKAELKTEFFASKPKTATSDPDAWFTKMELIKAKLKLDYGYVIEEEDYIEQSWTAYLLTMMQP